jgi:hypothetical protein
LSASIAPCKKKGLEREVEGYRLHLEEMVAERTHQIETALKLVERSYEGTLEALGTAIDLRDAATKGTRAASVVSRWKWQKSWAFPRASTNPMPWALTSTTSANSLSPMAFSLSPVPSPTKNAYSCSVTSRSDMTWSNKSLFRGCRGTDPHASITSDRPYRSALPFEEGFRVIHSESGRLFDPQITGAFFSIPKETWPSIAWNQHEVSSLRLGCAAAALSPRSLQMSPVAELITFVCRLHNRRPLPRSRR